MLVIAIAAVAFIVVVLIVLLSPRRLRAVVCIGIVGFFVPVLCSLFQMVLFTAKELPPAVDFIYWKLPYIICPPWALGDGRAFWMFAIPLLNSALYASLALAFFKLRRLAR